MRICLELKCWTIGGPLTDGVGGFGSVFEATDDDGNDVVAKFVPKVPGADRELLLGDSARAARYKNVVPVLDRGQHQDQWVIIMPRCLPSLAQHLDEIGGRLEVSDAISVLRDIAVSLADIAGEIVHRDLKPQNVLLHDGVWCLADFGIARYAEATTAPDTRKYSLTPAYAAPEQWRLQRATSATDVYAFGILAHQILTGELPFTGPDFREQHLGSTPPYLALAPTRLRGLIQECLFKAPEVRPKPAAILVRLDSVAEQPSLPSHADLALANEQEVRRQVAAQIEASLLQQDSDARLTIAKAADTLFETVVTALWNEIAGDAPAAQIAIGGKASNNKFTAELGGAALTVSQTRVVAPWGGPFSVISTASIAVRTMNPVGWSGREHSLWFCDAQIEDEFAWHELAFMKNPVIRSDRQVELEPFALEPLRSREAFQGILGAIQLAWPVEGIIRDNVSIFVNRWLGWFAEAVQRRLNRPDRMPERPTGGSWRK